MESETIRVPQQSTSTKKVVNALRWLAFIPAAFAGALLFTFFYSITLGFLMGGVSPFAGHFILGVCIILLGSMVAPSEHVAVTWVLWSLAIAFFLMNAIGYGLDSDWWGVAKACGLPLGASAVLWVSLNSE